MLTPKLDEATNYEVECSKCVPGLEQLPRFTSHSSLGSAHRQAIITQELRVTRRPQ